MVLEQILNMPVSLIDDAYGRVVELAVERSPVQILPTATLALVPMPTPRAIPPGSVNE